MGDMRHINRTLSIIILFCMLALSSCGSKESSASTTVSENGKPEQVDIIAESQKTRQELANNVAMANSMLASLSADGVPADSTDIIRHTSGVAPSNYKPQGQLYNNRFTSHSAKTYSVSIEPDSITTIPPAVITSNPQPTQPPSAPSAPEQAHTNTSANSGSSGSSAINKETTSSSTNGNGEYNFDKYNNPDQQNTTDKW